MTHSLYLYIDEVNYYVIRRYFRPLIHKYFWSIKHECESSVSIYISVGDNYICIHHHDAY